MGRYILGRYVQSSRSLDFLNPAKWEILDALSDVYPAGCTAKELERFTNKPGSSTSRNLHELERENYVVRMPGEKGRGVKPSSIYIIEESSGILQTLFDYQLSPGIVKFSDDFKNAWEILVPKEDETNLLREMMQFIEKVVRLIRESDQEAIKNIAPNLGKDRCCENCGLNHEARDFVRVILIHLIDRLEIQREFVEFQNKNQLLRQTAVERIIELSDQLIREDERKVMAASASSSCMSLSTIAASSKRFSP